MNEISYAYALFFAVSRDNMFFPTYDGAFRFPRMSFVPLALWFLSSVGSGARSSESDEWWKIGTYEGGGWWKQANQQGRDALRLTASAVKDTIPKVDSTHKSVRLAPQPIP